MMSSADSRNIFWVGDTLWSLCGQARRLLFDRDGLCLEEWKRNGQATLVKSASGRTIHRVRFPDWEIYVKHFKATNLLSRLHQMVRRSRAEKEFQLAHLLNDWGISTIRPVALGERRRNGVLLDSYLLTEAIPDGITLYELIDHRVMTGQMPFPPRLRFHFAEELAALAAAIHEHGVEHGDLHERNIVVQPLADGRYRFHLLDLHEVEIHQPLSWDKARDELARMGRYFTLRTSTVDRLRFFRRYGELRGFDRQRIDQLCREVERATIQSRADFWRRRDRRAQSKNHRICAYRRRGAVAFALRQIPAKAVHRLMREPNLPFREALVRWWKVGRRTRVAEVDLPWVQSSSPLIYKQYYFKGWHESIAALLRLNQSSRAWRRGGSLLLRELPTPRPLVLVHKTRWGLPVTSYLITERIPGAETILQYVDRQLTELGPPKRKQALREILAGSARLLRTMHDRNITHRDLKASNILVSHAGSQGKSKLWLIDLDGVHIWQRVPQRHRVQNLTRFYVNFHRSHWLTRTDLLRFLKLYLGREFRDRGHWKTLWRRIECQTRKKLRRNQRKGRYR